MIIPRILVNPFLLQALFRRNNLFINPLSSIVFLEALVNKTEQNYFTMKMKRKDSKDKSLVKLVQRQWSSANKVELEAVAEQEQITILNLLTIFDKLEETKESITLMELSWMLLEKLKDSITTDPTMADPWPKIKSWSWKWNTLTQFKKEEHFKMMSSHSHQPWLQSEIISLENENQN